MLMQRCSPSHLSMWWTMRNHLIFLLLVGLVFFTIALVAKQHQSAALFSSTIPRSKAHLPLSRIQPLNASLVYPPHRFKCRFHLCFDISRCVFSTEDIIGVHIGAWQEFHHSARDHSILTPLISSEYAELVKAVRGSKYNVHDPSRACVFIPYVDTLRQGLFEPKLMSEILNSLPG